MKTQIKGMRALLTALLTVLALLAGFVGTTQPAAAGADPYGPRSAVTAGGR